MHLAENTSYLNYDKYTHNMMTNTNINEVYEKLWHKISRLFKIENMSQNLE